MQIWTVTQMSPKPFFLVLILAGLLTLCSLCQSHTNYTLTYENYIVTAQDKTLWQIAERYKTPNVYIPEYTESIIELNYDSIFYAREKAGQRGMIRTGDVLRIPVWVVEK